MAVTVIIPTPLRQSSGGKSELVVDAATAGAALQSLATTFPEMRAHLFREDGTLRNFINIYVGDEDLRHLDGLDTKLKDGDTVMIVPAIAGGASVSRS
jgi:adenylyltransferase/sulfurtransferase